ncbi:MAG: trehalase family glycosidase [candidate division WOR-3 bacterium]|nr:trehalase family glycosidase [candidate division WOR-3 bacterium]
MKKSILSLAALFLITAAAQEVGKGKALFPDFLRKDANWSSWMACVSESPLADRIYYSNGIISTVELGDRISHQEFIVARNAATPDTLTCRFSLIELETIFVYDFAGQESFAGNFERMNKVRISYEGDRVAFDCEYHPLLSGHVEEYIPWNSRALVHKVVLSRPMKGELQDRRVRFAVRAFSKELREAEYDSEHECLHFFDPSEPFHIIVKSDQPVESYAIDPPNFGIPTESPYLNKEMDRPWRDIGVLGFLFSIDPGQSAELNVVFSFGLTKEEALAEAEKVLADDDKFSTETRQFWNDFYASCPLVAPESPMTYVNQASGRKHDIYPEELIKSELWNWHGLLTDVCRAKYLQCSPITVADWGEFVGMWSNDGIEEAAALSYTNQWRLAKESIINWFKRAVNYKKGDGHCSWTLYPSGLTSFDHIGALDEHTEGVPFPGRVVGQYVRATGDTSILDVNLGEQTQSRTLWQQLKAYENHLLEIRDINGDHLLDWLHMYETGWDNKHSPFIKCGRAPTTAINEQVFRLWSLSEVAYLAKLRGEDPTPWQEEMERVRREVEQKLWSNVDSFYHDYDVKKHELWLVARNLDAFYWLYYERIPERISKMLERLRNPAEFSASLLPTLSLNNPDFRRDGYWDGRAWPREHAYVGVALDRAGYALLGFQWVARAITANLGPILPETLDPLADPVELSFVGPCRLMGYNALNCLALVDIAGLRMWDGEELVIMPHPDLPQMQVINQKWNGDVYDAIADPKEGITLFRNGREVARFGLGPGRVSSIRSRP